MAHPRPGIGGQDETRPRQRSFLLLRNSLGRVLHDEGGEEERLLVPAGHGGGRAEPGTEQALPSLPVLSRGRRFRSRFLVLGRLAVLGRHWIGEESRLLPLGRKIRRWGGKQEEEEEVTVEFF